MQLDKTSSTLNRKKPASLPAGPGWGRGSCHFPVVSCPSGSQGNLPQEQGPLPHLLASAPALTGPVPGAVGRGGQCGAGHGGKGAYRGGAGRENVITRSSLLKVRHRLAGNRVHGGGGSPWARAGVEARRWPRSLPYTETQETLAPGTGGHRQIRHRPAAHSIWRGDRRRASVGPTGRPSGQRCREPQEATGWACPSLGSQIHIPPHHSFPAQNVTTLSLPLLLRPDPSQEEIRSMDAWMDRVTGF